MQLWVNILENKDNHKLKTYNRLTKKPIRKELKHNTKVNHQTIKGKTKRRKEQRRNTKSTEIQGLKWQ